MNCGPIQRKADAITYRESHFSFIWFGCDMDPRVQALDKLAEILERCLVSSKRSLRYRFTACAQWAPEESAKDKAAESISESDVKQCRDLVKVLMGSNKARTESMQRSTLRHLVLLKTLPSDVPLHDKRLIDIVAELRKRLSIRLPALCSGAASMPASNASVPLPSASVSLSNVPASAPATSESVTKTPRHGLGASISYEECLRRRVIELEKELEDAKQRLEKLLRDTPSV